MISKRAVEFLAVDVRNVMAEIETLDANIREFEAKREAARIKLDLLKKAIGPDFQSELDLVKPIAITAGTANVALELGQPAAIQSAGGNDAGGFRAAIRAVLSNATRGMKPKDICTELQKRGVPFTGKVPPLTRTHNELWRMSKKGQLRRRTGLYYAQEAA